MTRRHILVALVAGPLSLLLAGCASIIKGGDQQVQLKSEPSDARVVIVDAREGKEIHQGATPLTVTLKRGAGYFKKARYRVSIEKPGYQKEEIAIEGSPGGWYIGGNLLFGGLIGYLIVDPATGAMWTLDPEDVMITLKRPSSFRPDPDGLVIALRSDVPASLVPALRPLAQTP